MSSERVHERVTDDQGLHLAKVILDRAQEFIAGLTPEQADDLIEGRAHLTLSVVEPSAPGTTRDDQEDRP